MRKFLTARQTVIWTAVAGLDVLSEDGGFEGLLVVGPAGARSLLFNKKLQVHFNIGVDSHSLTVEMIA